MIKSSILDPASYHISVRNSIKSKWFILLILFPIGFYIGYLLLETQLLSFIIPFFPKEPDKSVAFYRDFLSLVFSEMLWLSSFLLLSWLFVVYVPLFQVTGKLESYAISSSAFYASAIVSLSFIFSVLIAYYTLETFPNSSDEYAYLTQASTLGHGRLWDNAHDYTAFFNTNHIAQKDGIRVSRFPPGWPAILSSAFYFGFPAYLVNPFLGLLSLIVFYQFAKRFYGEKIALWSLLSLALASFYIFNSASYFSHTSCLLATLSFVYCLYLYFEKTKIPYLILAGFFLGLIVTIRYYTAVILFLPFLIYLIYHHRLKTIQILFWLGIGSLPCLMFFFWYNYSITGNPLLPVTLWAYDDEALGFVRGHTVMKGFEHLVRWGAMFLYWCSPALILLYFIYLFRKIKDKAQRVTHPEDYFFILLVIGYFFYYQIGGNQYGPRFFFEALPFVILFVVRKIFQFREKWALALFCAGMIYALLKIPFIAQREHQVVYERKDVYAQVQKKNIHNAVVLVSTHGGVIRPMPVGDLIRNDIYFTNDVLYAHDIPKCDSLLMNYYADRTFYRYVRDPEKVEGKLVKIK